MPLGVILGKVAGKMASKVAAKAVGKAAGKAAGKAVGKTAGKAVGKAGKKAVDSTLKDKIGKAASNAQGKMEGNETFQNIKGSVDGAAAADGFASIAGDGARALREKTRKQEQAQGVRAKNSRVLFNHLMGG